jgi:glycosyltransferase involved in cell wall biosynthesis
MTNWICSQFGSRENYAIPRALHRRQALRSFYTDIWIHPSSSVARVIPTANRFQHELNLQDIHAFNTLFLSRHLARKAGVSIDADDDLYDELVSKHIAKGKNKSNLFAYSYSSMNTMRVAKELGHRTFLGQINPGPLEAEIVKNAFASYRNGRHHPTVPDDKYWDRWREEISYSDILIVNSEWSSILLQQAGVPSEKIAVVPLAYEVSNEFPERQFKKYYDRKQTLNLLYLGGVGLRKGFHLLIEAMKSIPDLPITLRVVGGLKGPRELLEELPPNVMYFGYANRLQTEQFYADADVLIFPTLSDGFGLTQLEAQARKLPLIVSNHCARIIDDMHNGIVLEEVTAESIALAITKLVDQPELLPQFSGRSISMENFSIDSLAARLLLL